MAKVATREGITRLRLEAGPSLMKSVCPVKVKINWRSGDGYRGNQPVPVVFKRTVHTCFALNCILFTISFFTISIIFFPFDSIPTYNLSTYLSYLSRHYVNFLLRSNFILIPV